MKKLFALLAFLCSALVGRANNVQITGVSTSVTGGTTTVNFNISWENSWRGGPASNYDAVWVFVKYYDDNSTWSPLKMTGNDITAPSGLTVDIASDKAGAFVYRSADGAGNITSSAISIGVNQKAGSYDMKVFALEMVYIPQGPFWAGFYAAGFNYHEGGSAAPLLIDSAVPPAMGGGSGQLFDARGNGPLNASFPTGYNAYYMMKYELSQAGYRDFLNTQNGFYSSYLPERSDLTAANYGTPGTKLFTAGVRSNLKVKSNSSVIGADANNNAVFDETTDGEWTACGSLLWSDAAAFLDWACLRPMTELEYEKAAMGPDPQAYANFATGTFWVPLPTGGINNANTSGESQVRTPGVINYINTSEGTIDGPLRGGYAADATSDRKLSGGSYYGVMELSGNLWEPCVTTSNAAGRSYKGNLGDGVLSFPLARANQSSWPGIQNAATTVNGGGDIRKDYTAGIGMRGGSFMDDFNSADVYSKPDPSTYPTLRDNAQGYGCRGVRQP